MLKRFFPLLLVFALLLSLFSCGEEYYGHAELRISLPRDFKSFEAENFDSSYTDGECIVGIYRISFEAGFNQGIPDFLTAREFALFYMQATKRESQIKDYGTVPYYEYEEVQDGLTNVYTATFFRSKYAYFILLFATPVTLHEEKLPEILSYTDTVIFIK